MDETIANASPGGPNSAPEVQRFAETIQETNAAARKIIDRGGFIRNLHLLGNENTSRRSTAEGTIEQAGNILQSAYVGPKPYFGENIRDAVKLLKMLFGKR